MKNVKIIFITLALLASTILSANAKLYEAEKVVNHSFPASSKHTLTVDNKYGHVTIEAWDKNEVSATITITGQSSRSQNVANDLVDRVSINANASGSSVTFRTEIATTKLSSTGGNQSFQISYKVKVPRNIAFNLTNKYGDIRIDECGNKASIDVKYGNYYCAKMTDKGSSLTLGYGNANIQEVNALAADIKYSNLTLGTANSLSLSTKYSNFKFNTVGSIAAYSGYDNYKLKEVNSANIDTKYSPINIGKVNESLSLVNKYGSVTVDEVGTAAKLLEFELGYTDLKLNISPSISYEVDAATRYGSITLPSGVTTDIKHRVTEKNTSTVKATVGKGTPTLKVKASNSYANIKLTAK